MSEPSEFTQLFCERSLGNYGAFALQINVAATRLPDLKADAIWLATRAAAAGIKSAIMEAVIAADLDAQANQKKQREALTGLFPAPIFVEEIPNGYCRDYCCKHLPWFIVTTNVGRIKIGCRKRVIEIDWSDAPGTKTADELFASEDVTKGERSIHAWGLPKAAEYVRAILSPEGGPQ